jgi:hypothetical protein
MYKALLLLALALPAAAQVKLEADPNPQPKLVNAQLQTASAKDGLRAAFDVAMKQSGRHWIGYAVPTLPRPRFMCCFDFQNWKNSTGCCSGCRLENEHNSVFNSDGGTCVDQHQPPTHVFVLFRAEEQKVTRIRTFTPDCGLDAGNLPVTWLTDVKSGESLQLLAGFVQGDGRSFDEDRTMGDSALMAIVMHQDAAANKLMEGYLAASQPFKLRKQAAFWLGVERGHEGFEILKRVVPKDADERFRSEATFAISQDRDREAIELLVGMAHDDASPRVRSQAIFWLAQEAGSEAAKAITSAVDNDPDSAVRKKAVFALSQMPKDQGIPLLIKYAKGHKDPAVRKEAIFWLGDSNDPRALDFLEDFLLGKKGKDN